MKTVATFPACDVVDLEMDLITLPYDLVKQGSSIRFCVSKETTRHGNLYPEIRPYCVAYCAMDYDEDPDAARAREKERGHALYWIHNCATSITAGKRARYTMFLIRPGQRIVMDGTLLEVVKMGYDHYKFKTIEG